jgi:NTP pyrophosphatase (non-canonical NTP hydrolase)
MNELLAPALDLVREFHRDKGLPLAVSLEEATSPAQLRELGDRVFEEALELRRAITLGDLAEVIKELADVVYSSLGVVVALDLSLDDAFASMKISGPTGPADDGPLGRPMAALRVAATERGLRIPTSIELSSDALALAERIIGHSLALRDMLATRRRRRVERELTVLLLDSFALALTTGVPLSVAFMDIHHNNMTKRRARRQGGVTKKPRKGPDFEKVDLSRLLSTDSDRDPSTEGEQHRD